MSENDKLTEVVLRTVTSDDMSGVILSIVFNNDFKHDSHHIHLRHNEDRLAVLKLLRDLSRLILKRGSSRE